VHDVVPNRIADEIINNEMRSALTGPRLDKEPWRRAIPCMLESISSIPFVDWAADGESIMAPNARHRVLLHLTPAGSAIAPDCP